MTGKALWQNLKTLVDSDRKILATQQNIEHLSQQIDAAQKKIAGFQSSLEQKKRQLAAEKKNVAANELQASYLKETEEHKRKALDNVKGAKDYKAIEKEIAAASSQRSEHEDILVRSWYTLDQLEKSIVAEELRTLEKTELLQRDIVSLHEQISEQTQQLQHLNASREQAVLLVPEEWLTRYNRMQTSIPDPIVPVHKSSCSGCYYAVPRQDLIRLKTAGVLLCRSCYRFLYFDFAEECDADKASF